MMNMRELMRRKADLLAEARKMNDGAEKENRDLSEQESTRYNEIMAEVEQINGRVERGQRLENLEQAAGRAGERQLVTDGQIGMSRDELRRYSIVRAINAAASQDWRNAQLEREASEATAKRMGRSAQGFWVPQDVLAAEQRDMVAGTPSAGGYLVSTDLLAQSFIELLRNRMMVRAAGATVLAGLVGDVAIPKQTGGATAYWVGESTAPTEGAQTLGQVALSPKTVGAWTDISRKLLKQSSVDVEAFVRNDLTSVLGLAIDSSALHGPGTGNAPTGIAATSGIGDVAGGTDGLAPTWAHMVALETAVAVDNADLGRLAYMSNAKVRGKLKSTPRTATYGDIMIWEPTSGNTPVNGYPFHVTNQVSSTLTKGSGTGVGVCSAIFFGNWADLIIGMWGGLDILVDPYTGGTAGTVRVIALQDVDVAVRHAESFAAMLDALTA
jgi:HK97 family phage major capsid protein